MAPLTSQGLFLALQYHQGIWPMGMTNYQDENQTVSIRIGLLVEIDPRFNQPYLLRRDTGKPLGRYDNVETLAEAIRGVA